MDALAAFLDGPRAAGAFVLKALLDPPWSLRIQDESPLTVVVMLRGSAWVVHDGITPVGISTTADPVALGPGDVAIIRGSAPYTVADDPATPVQIVIHPGQRCTTPDGASLSDALDLGLRTWGTAPDGEVAMLVGTYRTEGEVSQPLLDALPLLAVQRAADWSSPYVDLLADELGREGMAQDAVLDRLLDLLLVAAVRAWFADHYWDAPYWSRAWSDPVVGPALRYFHSDPARQWTVEEVAELIGVSRAKLARRFHYVLGEPPFAHLTAYRLALAADLLVATDLKVKVVAERVGYLSSFTFSTAFKRVQGLSPRNYRLRELAARAEAADPGETG